MSEISFTIFAILIGSVVGILSNVVATWLEPALSRQKQLTIILFVFLSLGGGIYLNHLHYLHENENKYEELQEDGQLHEEYSDSTEELESSSLSSSDNTESPNNYYAIKLENNSSTTILVVVRYENSDEIWITEGWWEIKPDEIITTELKSINRYIYVHAENDDGDTWGDDYEFYVIDDVFKFKGDYHSKKSYKVSFFEQDTGEEWIDHTVKFSD